MEFAHSVLECGSARLNSSSVIVERTKGHNYRFEEQVSVARRCEFEEFCKPDANVSPLEELHVRYWEERCKDALIPETFLKSLDPAAHGALDENQSILRVEDISRQLESRDDYENLKRAWEEGEQSALEAFLNNWNRKRDFRPSFAAFRDDLADTLLSDDWQHDLRDRLGLAHLNPKGASIFVALISMPIRDVLGVCQAEAVPITKPTVLDSGPAEYFFPAPKEVHYGRVVCLTTDHDETNLQSELLHVRVPYEPRHIIGFGIIEKPIPDVELKDLRNHHLLCLRMETGREDFGEDIP